MKNRKQLKLDEQSKKLLRSLSWITDVLKRYFEGKLTRQEEAIVEEQLKSIDHQSDTVKNKLTEKQLNESDKRIKKQVFFKLNLIDPEKEPERQAIPFLPEKPLKKSLSVYFRKYAAVAAIFVTIVATSYFMFNEHSPLKEDRVASLENKTMLLHTGETEMKELILPDGTKLYVNGGSRIDYIENQFNKKKREIWLEGEAFCEVAKNPDKPFIIHSGNIQTVVRGTSFNVKAYKEIGEVSVSVRNGKVEVGTADNVFGVLTANKRIVYHEKTDQYIISESNWEEDAAWRERRLILKDANIAELKLRLKQLYGVDISVEGGFPDDQRFGLSFRKDANLTDVMELIGELYGIKYKTAGSGKIILYQ